MAHLTAMIGDAQLNSDGTLSLSINVTSPNSEERLSAGVVVPWGSSAAQVNTAIADRVREAMTFQFGMTFSPTDKVAVFGGLAGLI